MSSEGQTSEKPMGEIGTEKATAAKAEVASQPRMGLKLKFDTLPFTDKTLHSLSERDNWDELYRLLEPVTCTDFAVTDTMTRLLVDGVRLRFDSSVDSQGGNAVMNLVSTSGLSLFNEGEECTLKLLLSAGLSPDIADTEGWRPSHVCGLRGSVEMARMCFPCRPDMLAKNQNSSTPLEAALITYNNDEKNPGRGALRPLVADVIREFTQGGTENGFRSIAELACRKMWFAVKNLIRRRVVNKEEFARGFSGRTADEWADYHGFVSLKDEILYYRHLATFGDSEEMGKKIVELCDDLDKCQEKNEVLQKKVEGLEAVENENISLRAALEQKEKEMMELKQLLEARLEDPLGPQHETDNDQK